MFGQPKPVVFHPYGKRSTSWRPPRWLLLMLGGMAAGISGVLYVQARHLPPRLSATESTELRSAYDTAHAERTQFKAQLEKTSQALSAALADKQKLSEQLASSQSAVATLREDVQSAVNGLPPDPRGGSVEVRAARFSARGNQLHYEVVLTRERASGKPLPAQLQLTLSGEGAPAPMKPIAVNIGSVEIARGSLPLPASSHPRQATVQVLDKTGGKSLGMRVLLVK